MKLVHTFPLGMSDGECEKPDFRGLIPFTEEKVTIYHPLLSYVPISVPCKRDCSCFLLRLKASEEVKEPL